MHSFIHAFENEIHPRNLPSVRLLEAGQPGNFTQAFSSAEVRLAFARRSGEARQDEGGLNIFLLKNRGSL